MSVDSLSNIFRLLSSEGFVGTMYIRIAHDILVNNSKIAGLVTGWVCFRPRKLAGCVSRAFECAWQSARSGEGRRLRQQRYHQTLSKRYILELKFITSVLSRQFLEKSMKIITGWQYYCCNNLNIIQGRKVTVRGKSSLELRGLWRNLRSLLVVGGVQLHVVLECVAAVEPLGTEVAGEGHLSAVDQVVLLNKIWVRKHQPWNGYQPYLRCMSKRL